MTELECGNSECDRPRKDGMLACRICWFRLPKKIRDAVWAGYRANPGGLVHRAAIAVAREWWRANPEAKP